MKKLITIILTSFIVSNAVGQESDTTASLIDTNYYFVNTGEHIYYKRKRPQIDTVAIWLLVSDTTKGTTYAAKLYDVSSKIWTCCTYTPNSASYYWDYTHLEYLDEKKKPLSKNIIAWQSINQK